MDTDIVKRADRIYMDLNTDLVLDSASDYQRLGYIRGAKEQRKIDTEKACFAFCVAIRCNNRVNLACRETCEKLMMFKQTMEEEP